MVFVTGDTHFPIDGDKLFKEQREFPFSTLQRTDYVIVLGDFGLFWRIDIFFKKPRIGAVAPAAEIYL